MNSPNNPNKVTQQVIFVLGVLMAFGLVFGLFAVRSMSMMVILPAIMIAVMLFAMIAVVALRNQKTQSEQDLPDWMTDAEAPKVKPKRGDVDMYTLIDELVEDLTEDEARYLMRKLEENDRQRLTADIEDVLDARRRNRE